MRKLAFQHVLASHPIESFLYKAQMVCLRMEAEDPGQGEQLDGDTKDAGVGLCLCEMSCMIRVRQQKQSLLQRPGEKSLLDS